MALLTALTIASLASAVLGLNSTQLQDAFWLTVNVTTHFELPPTLATYSWTNKTCIPHGEGAGDAVELIQQMPSPIVAWIAGGDDPIPQETWEDYDTLPGYPKWAKNGDGRNTTFVESCFYASPDVDPNCDPYTDCFAFMYTPPAVGYLNYTWMHMDTLACPDGNQIYPLLSNWSSTTTTPPPGYIAYGVHKQCKQNVFPNTIYRLQDPWGGWYALHAHNGDYINATNSVLPPGFTVAEYTFPDDEYLLVNPVGEDCLLVILRDANNNGYYQVVYGNQTMWSATNNTNCTNPQAELATSPLPMYQLLPSDEVSSSST